MFSLRFNLLAQEFHKHKSTTSFDFKSYEQTKDE